ncbi:hypothetical protein CYANOKiyG1_21480 [Okeania sp. KiyG1]|nr:hypothetical protein CYANOKiyG1_21480 [Okeania sp. KiyG1]
MLIAEYLRIFWAIYKEKKGDYDSSKPNTISKFDVYFYQNNMGRTTPSFKVKYFWRLAQIPVTKITSDF